MKCYAMYPVTVVSPVLVWWIAALMGLAACAGCGSDKQVLSDRARASGTVTFDGQPLPAGTVLFSSMERPSSTAVAIFGDGVYSTDRAPIGKNVVTIDTASIQYGNPAAYVAIPDKYSDPRTSGFTVEIEAGENENVDFALEK